MSVRRFWPVIVLLLAVMPSACSDPANEKSIRYEKGQSLARENRYAEAILEFRNALEADPKFAAAHLAIAEAYERTDDTVNAYRSYQRAADLAVDSVEIQLAAARFLLQVRQFADARTRATRALEIDPQNATAHMVLGSALAGLKDVNGAITQVQEAIDLAPSSATGYTGMGALLLTQGKREDALAQFEKAVEAAPRSAEPRVALAAYHWSIGEVKKTETLLQEALAIEPEHAMANRAIALLYMTTRRAPEAEPFLKVVSRTAGTPEAELPLADYYVRGGRLREAREILERAATTGNASAIVRLARLDFAENHRERAHKAVDRLLARQPSNSEALIAKGRWLLQEGKSEEARERAEIATERDPGNAAAFLLLADVRTALGLLTEAATAYTQVIRLNPRAAAAHTALSRLSMAEGKPDTSVAFARGALQAEPGNDEARILLAKGFLQRRELQRAEEEIAILSSRRGDDPAVIALQGTLKMRQGDRAGARKAFDAALRKDPVHIDALTGLTALDGAEGQISTARGRLSALLVSHPRSVPLLLLAARADMQAGDFAAGEARARTAIEVDASHLKAYELLGAAYIRQQKLEAALAEFEQVIVKQPRSIGALTVIGMLHQALGQAHEAEKAYQKAVQIDPQAAVAANNLAFMLAERGDNLEYALVLAREAAMGADDPVVLDTLGFVYLKKGQPREAIPAFSKAIRLAPENPVYHYHLGLAYADAEEPDRARASLEAALKLNPDFPGAAEARDRLRTLTN